MVSLIIYNIREEDREEKTKIDRDRIILSLKLLRSIISRKIIIGGNLIIKIISSRVNIIIINRVIISSNSI